MPQVSLVLADADHEAIRRNKHNINTKSSLIMCFHTCVMRSTLLKMCAQHHLARGKGAEKPLEDTHILFKCLAM